MELRDLGEFGLIERLARRLAQSPAHAAAGEVRLGIGDDAAVLELPPGRSLVATCDALIEEVHFRRDWSQPEEIGWKSLAANVSDLDAMGARPLGALITLAAPPGVPVRWIDRLYQGLAECAAAYGCPLVGGDTVRSPRHLAISVTALGSALAGHEVFRSGARVGDLLCVTGVLGDSGAGLALLERGRGLKSVRYRSLLERHRRPRPPAPAGALLAEAGLPSAMLDLSDGLSSDLRHLAKRSGVGLEVEAARVPISDAARQAALALKLDPLAWALHGGEDYQLCFTVPAERWEQVPPTLGPVGVVATMIGRVNHREIVLVQPDGRSQPLRPEGFAHFRG